MKPEEHMLIAKNNKVQKLLKIWGKKLKIIKKNRIESDCFEQKNFFGAMETTLEGCIEDLKREMKGEYNV